MCVCLSGRRAEQGRCVYVCGGGRGEMCVCVFGQRAEQGRCVCVGGRGQGGVRSNRSHSLGVCFLHDND